MTRVNPRALVDAGLRISLAWTVACGAGGVAGRDASVDANTDRSVSGKEAGVDRSVRDAGRLPNADASVAQLHFVDASVVCEGGGSWGPCFVTDAADLACEASSDCTWQPNGGTCCGVPTVGVNKRAPYVGCPGLPCPPPKTYQPACQEYFTQDCQAVAAPSDVTVECVDHRCSTRAGSK